MSDQASKQVLSGIVADFEQQYSCQVEMTELSWGDGKAKLFAAFSSGTAPDVLELGSDWVAQFSYSGVLFDIGDAATVLAPYQEFSRAPAEFNNRAFALPWVVDTRVMYGNTQVIGADVDMPNTLTELETSAKSLHSDKTIAVGVNGPDAHRLYKKVLPFVWSVGGALLNEAGEPTLNSPEVARGVQAYVDQLQYGKLNTQRELDAAFVQGRIGYWMSGSWLIPKLLADSNKVTARAFLFPGIDGPGVSFAGGEYIALSATTKQPELARKFAEYVTSAEQALRFCKGVAAAGFPAHNEGLNSQWFADMPFKGVFAEQLQHSRMTPVHPQWLEIERVFEGAVESVLLGNTTTEDALQHAQLELEKTLKE